MSIIWVWFKNNENMFFIFYLKKKVYKPLRIKVFNIMLTTHDLQAILIDQKKGYCC